MAYGLFHLWIEMRVGGKLCDPSLTPAIPERLWDEQLIIKRCTNKASFAFTFYSWSLCVIRPDIAKNQFLGRFAVLHT